MGIFGQSTPFDTDIEKATSETNTTENWALIMEVCDKVSSNTRSSKECLKAIMKRMAHADPHVVMQAVTLLDACANNCGKSFHLEIASREFENEFRRLLKAAQPKISLKMRQVLKSWAENDFKSDPELNLIPTLYLKLRLEGYDFRNLDEKPPKSAAKLAALKDPNVVSSQQEQEDIAKAIELSLKEAKNSPKKQLQQTSSGASATSGGAAYPSLYPSFAGAAGAVAAVDSASSAAAAAAAVVQPELRKVRALYDFEAAEENELTFFAGEIIYVIDDSDPNWWKGQNQRGDGLFPSNFVTADLSVDPERLDINQQQKAQKSAQFDNDAAKELQLKTEAANQPVEIDETKIDRLLHLLHEANPEDPSQDTEEMLRLEQEVHKMGPLIDAELERVDRKHAQLTQLSVDLVDAINLYHSLMRDDRAAATAMLSAGGGGLGGGFMGAGGGGMPGGMGGLPGMPLGMGYQPNPHLALYGPAGYPGAGGSFPPTPQQQQQQPLGQSGYPGAASFASGAQMLGANNLPAQQNGVPTGAGGPAGYAPHQMSMPIPMQYQNGGLNAATQLNGGGLSQTLGSPIPPHMFAAHQQQQQPTTPQQQQQQQQHNYQMMPPQQQQAQFPQQQQQPPPQQTLGQNPNLNATTALDQQQQQQQQQQMQPTPTQFMTAQPNQAYMHPQQQQQQQPHFLPPMPNGPTSFMMPAAAAANNNNNNNTLHHPHPPNSNDFSQLQQQMAAMSMAAAANAAAAINQPVTQNFLVQNEPKNNIPIYQQQR